MALVKSTFKSTSNYTFYLICGDNSNLYTVFIDGVSKNRISSGASSKFTTGEHLLEYVLIDDTIITDETFNSVSLKNITLPNTITKIGSKAFGGSINTIYVEATVAPSIEPDTFIVSPTNGTLYYPKGSDYSTWISVLGEKGWTAIEYDVEVNPMETYGLLGYFEEQMFFNYTGNTFTYEIPNNNIDYWEVNKYFDWINISGDNGVWQITVPQNTDIEDRIDIISFTAFDYEGRTLTNKLTIIQEAQDGINPQNYILGLADGDRTTDRIYSYSDSFSDILVNGNSIGITKNVTLNKGDVVKFVLKGDEIGKDTFMSGFFLDAASISYGVKTIRATAFYQNSYAKAIKVPNTVNLIERAAFGFGSGLRKIKLSNSITEITESTFVGCSKLKEIDIPLSVKTIGVDAFEECESLTSIVIPDSVTSIGLGAFMECGSLTSIVVSEGNTVYDSRENCNCIIESATNKLIQGCNNSIIPDSVTSIGQNAFIGCKSLTSITIPDSVTSIAERVFYGCKKLSKVTIGSGVTSISDEVFEGCSKLSEVTIGSGVTSIGMEVFANCESLTSIVIPDSVTSIGSSVFYGCKKLSEITCYAPTAPTISYWTFNSVATGGTLYYPAGSDYSQWLSTDRYYLGYYGWDGVPIGDVPEPPVEPDVPEPPVEPDEPEPIPDGEIVTPDTTMIIGSDGRTFQYTIETNNIDFLFAYQISFNGDYYIDTIDGFISMEMVDMNNFNITVEGNEGDERRCSIYFRYLDYNRNQLTHILTIIQDAKPEEEPDEPDVPPTPEEPVEPSYVILSNNDITLNGIGDTKDIVVTYANMGEIITPVVPEGYEIEEVERTDYEGNNTQVKYRLKKVSANKGNFIINFEGKDTSGKTVSSEDLNVTGNASIITPAEVTYYSYNTENGVMIFDYTGSTCNINFNIEGYTKPFDFHVSVNDDNYNVHIMENYLDYDDGVDYAVWKMVFESEGNDSNYAYEGNVVVTYTDANTEKIFTIPFHVRYANEGKLTLGSKEFRYDKDGELLTNYNTISVGYLNIQTKHQPTCSTWVTLGTPTQRGGTFYGIDEMWDYPISVQANEGDERTGFVRFTGLGVDGKEYAIEAVVKQEGNNTVIKVDEGYIELQSLSVTLLASGGSETFQVKYYDAAEIFEPELGDTWATITEVSRTEPADDVAWNGEECQSVIVTYKVTAKPTESGRQMKVKFFSDINYYDGGVVHMEKDKFIIYQLAEGSTEVQGSLHVLRSSLEYTYYGSPIGWNPEVGYTDLAPSTPIISESWCRIKSYTDKTSKEYDMIRTYDLELDTNESTLSRTCNITFIGEAEDGTDVRKTITITQKGQEEIINDGEYSNYKGYFRSLDNILYSVSFITNPRYDGYGDIRLAGESPVVVSYSESGRLFEPTRTSTCTVKVVSDKYLMNLYTGKAHGTQVILRNEDTDSVEWCGYLQPNLYNQGFTECFEEIEFEASDCLSTLQYFKYEPHYSNGRFTVSFKDIVNDIMTKSNMLDSYYITQKLYSDSFQSKYVNFQSFYIPEENFFSEEGEPWTYEEVLEEMCKYLGVVCFQWKDDLYFIDYDKYQTSKTMLGYRWDKSDNWYKMNYVTLSTPNQIVEESYKETGADVSLDDVFNKVTVNCNYYNFESIIPDLFDDDKLVNRFDNNGYISIARYTANHNTALSTQTYYRIYDHVNINSRYYKPLSGTSIHEQEVVPTDEEFTSRYFLSTYVGGNILDMVHLGYNEANGEVGEAKQWERYLMISQLNRPWCGAMGTFSWENYNFPIMEFKNLPVVFINNNVDEDTEQPIRRASSSSSSTPHNRQPVVKLKPVPNYLVIKAEAIFTAELYKEYFEGVAEGLGKKSSQDYYTYGNYTFDHIRNTPALCFYLEIPQAGWWNGSEWVHYKTHFEVRLDRFTDGSDDNKKWYEHLFGVSQGVYNTVETNLFLGTTGYKIPLPKEMTTTQEMYFAIAMPKRFVHLSDGSGGDYTGKAGNAYCFIKDLEVAICNRNSIFYKNEDMIYENIIDEGNVIEGDEIDLKITSDNYQGFSFSHVSTITSEEKNTTEINFYNKDMKLVKAEEAIIERYVNQYSTPSIKENVTLDMSFNPTQLITDTYWDKDFVIIGQEIDYQYDRQKLTLLEKK